MCDRSSVVYNTKQFLLLQRHTATLTLDTYMYMLDGDGINNYIHIDKMHPSNIGMTTCLVGSMKPKAARRRRRRRKSRFIAIRFDRKI